MGFVDPARVLAVLLLGSLGLVSISDLPQSATGLEAPLFFDDGLA